MSTDTALDTNQDFARKLLALLPSSGAPVGNKYLRRQLDVSDEQYWQVRDRLVHQRIVGVGRGRGGSTFRVVADLALDVEDDASPLETLEGGTSTSTPPFTGQPAQQATLERSTSDDRPSIDQIRVVNFKRISEASIDLAPITILVGGNNSGKSSVLQAVHTAVSCAQESELQNQKIVSEANLRFSPARDFAMLGNDAPYENRRGGRRGSVEFFGTAAYEPNHPAHYTIEMYKGRNHKNVGVVCRGTSQGFGQVISDPTNLFSVYVPGLSGIPLHEEAHGYASLFMRAAGGDANLVFRNIVERLARDNKSHLLQGHLQEILGYPVRLRVHSHPDRDLYVEATMARGSSPADSDFLPLELWGTGVLQITQLLAYALLFEPELLLIDEPDSHVHPSSQKKLMLALGRIAVDMKCRIIISTHSRHIVSSAPEAARFVWMKDGEVVSQGDPDLIAPLMDIGALDSFDLKADVLLATEDEDTRMLDSVVAGLPDERRVKLASFRGVKNATSAQAFKLVSELVGHGPRVAVHRDRDFLTEDEIRRWSENYEEDGVSVFCPKYCDVEYYYSTADHIASVTGWALEEAERVRSQVLADNDNIESFRKKFETKRRAANAEFWRGGGSPTNESLWPPDAPIPEEFVYGKDLLRLVDKKIRGLSRGRTIPKLQSQPSERLLRELQDFLDSLHLATP